MPRPSKFRMVEREPICNIFRPTIESQPQLEEVVISVEGIEAIRLKDLQGFEQEEAAECMHVSRATFQRLLIQTRESVARALVEGRALRIEGGNYRLRGPCCERGEGRRRECCRRQCYANSDAKE